MIDKNIMNIVRDLLVSNPLLRDDKDSLYYLTVQKYKGYTDSEMEKISLKDIYIGELKGRTPKYTTVARHMNLIQKQYPRLRGETYEKRKKIEKSVKSEMVEY